MHARQALIELRTRRSLLEGDRGAAAELAQLEARIQAVSGMRALQRPAWARTGLPALPCPSAVACSLRTLAGWHVLQVPGPGRAQRAPCAAMSLPRRPPWRMPARAARWKTPGPGTTRDACRVRQEPGVPLLLPGRADSSCLCCRRRRPVRAQPTPLATPTLGLPALAARPSGMVRELTDLCNSLAALDGTLRRAGAAARSR